MTRYLVGLENLVASLIRGARILLFAPSLDGIPDWDKKRMAQITIAAPSSQLDAYKTRHSDRSFVAGESLYRETVPFDTIYVHFDRSPKACVKYALDLGTEETQYIFLVHRLFADPAAKDFQLSFFANYLQENRIFVTELITLPADLDYTLLVARKLKEKPRGVRRHRAEYSESKGFYILSEVDYAERKEGAKRNRNAALTYEFTTGIQAKFSVKERTRGGKRPHNTVNARVHVGDKRIGPFERSVGSTASKEEVLEHLLYEDLVWARVTEVLNGEYGYITDPQTPLKLFWYLYRDEIQESLKHIKPETVQRLFAGENNPLSIITLSQVPDELFPGFIIAQETGCFPAEAQYFDILKKVLDIAVQKEALGRNPLSEKPNPFAKRQTVKEKAVVQALGKLSLSKKEEAKIVDYLFSSDGTEPNAPRYLTDGIAFACLIRLFSGVWVGELYALRWKDVIPVGENAHALYIRTLCNSHGEPADIKDGRTIRKIPIPEILSAAIQSRRDRIRPLPEDYLIPRTDCCIEGKVCSFHAAVRAMYKTLFREVAGIEPQMLSIPGEEREVNLSDHSHDLFRANYRFRCEYTCGFKPGELEHQLGLVHHSTFDLHYCDYRSDLVLEEIARKLNRWGHLYMAPDSFQHPIEIPCLHPITLETGPFRGNRTRTDLTVRAEETGSRLVLGNHSDHGVWYKATAYGGDMNGHE